MQSLPALLLAWLSVRPQARSRLRDRQSRAGVGELVDVSAEIMSEAL